MRYKKPESRNSKKVRGIVLEINESTCLVVNKDMFVYRVEAPLNAEVGMEITARCLKPAAEVTGGRNIHR